MRVAVVGANGQLGQDVCQAFLAEQNEVFALSHADVEIASLPSVQVALERIRPDLVVNTAAFHNVDRCEAEAVGAFAVNALGARNIARVTDAVGASLVHISTDYVFDGSQGAPYSENDPVGPLNVYGNTKLAGKYFVRAVARLLANTILITQAGRVPLRLPLRCANAAKKPALQR